MPLDTTSYYPDVPSSEPEAGRAGQPRVEPEKPESSLPEPEQVPEPVSQPEEPDGPKWLTLVCNILSWVLVPLLMPVYGVMLIFGLSILDIAPMPTRVLFTIIVFVFNVLIPMGMVMLLKKAGLVNDIGLNGRKERLLPYIITILCLGATAWFMSLKGAPLWMSMFFIGGAIAGVINLVVNFYWKISAHSAGIAGIVAMLLRIMRDGFPEPSTFSWLIAVILLAGLLGAARVWLGRHTVWQVLAGYAVGFCSVFFITLIH